MSRSFDRAVTPMIRAVHLGQQVLVPRDASKGFQVERARKERDLYRSVAGLEHAPAEGIAAFVSTSGALGRLPQVSQSTARALSHVVKKQSRETLARLTARSDLSPSELFMKALAESHAASLRSLKQVPAPDLTVKQSLVTAVLAEPLIRIVIEATEVSLRAIRLWDPVEGPAGLARRAAAVLRERARELATSSDEARRAPTPVLADLSDVLYKYAGEMAPPSLEARDALRALKDQVMRLPAPTAEGWGDPLATPDGEEPRSFEGDTPGLMIRLTLQLWGSFHEGSASELWCLPTAPLWPMVWCVAPMMFTAFEDLPGWEACIHDTVDVWRAFAKECRAWVRTIDALQGDERRSTSATRTALSAALRDLFEVVRPALGESGALADLVASDAVGARAALERLVELRCEAAGILPMARMKVLGTEGRALFSIRAALHDERIVRRCAGAGCTNVLSVDAAPQRKKCSECLREQTRRRVKKFRDLHAAAPRSAPNGSAPRRARVLRSGKRTSPVTAGGED